MRLTWHTDGSAVTGFRHLWLKQVAAFRPSEHCARCFVGKYDRRFGLRLPVNDELVLDYPAGTILYLCGVSMPYRWANNFHLALRVGGRGKIKASLYTGDRLTISGAERVLFDDAAARETFPQHTPDFLTCRNFQFGAHAVRVGLINLCEDIR